MLYITTILRAIWKILVVCYDVVAALVQFETAISRRRAAEHKITNAETFAQWKSAARTLDELEGYREWRVDENSTLYNFDEVSRRIRRMYELRQDQDWSALLEVLQTDFHRSMCGINNPLLFSYRTGTKAAVRTFVQLLAYLCRTTAQEAVEYSLPRRIRIISDIARAYGHSALILNSSAAFGVYQLGVIKALHEANLVPRIIFGVSSGALAAAFLCCRSDIDSLFRFDSVNYDAFAKRDAKGSFRRKMSRWLKEGVLMDVQVLLQFAKDNIGDMTFLEAYRKTGRVLNIQVSRYCSETGGEASWLLNYLTAPDVLISTAAVASCATKGLYGPVDILQKGSDGRCVTCDPATLRWTATLNDTHVNRAVERLRGMFNVTLFIVSEATLANLPFFRLGHRKDALSRVLHFFTEEYWRAAAWISRRALFRSSWSTYIQSLSEDVVGDIVIFPISSPFDVLKLFRNPEQRLVDHCCLRGCHQVWPHLERIRTHVSIEKALFESIQMLRGELQPDGGELLPALEHYEFYVGCSCDNREYFFLDKVLLLRFFRWTWI